MSKVEKPWGYEEWVEVIDRYVVKRLYMKKGNLCSLQYHERKKETLVVLSGFLTVYCNEQTHYLEPFDIFKPHVGPDTLPEVRQGCQLSVKDAFKILMNFVNLIRR